MFAQTPSLTTIARGGARPKPHGHATTNTLTKAFIAWLNSNPSNKYPINVTIAMAITAGTKYPLTLSATFAIGTLVLVASTTNWTILDIVDSLPIFSALYSRYPS